MATSDEEENIYTKPGAIRRGGNSNTAVGFYSRGVQPTDVQTSDDYSPPSEDPIILPEETPEDNGNNDPGGEIGGAAALDNPRFIDVDPTVSTLARVASLAAPTPIGLAIGAANAGVRANNVDWANAQREGLGLERLGGWETLKAAAGFSDYGDGKVGTVDIGGKQREVTREGGLVGTGPDTEKRTALTPAEALARQTASKSYQSVGGSDSNSDSSSPSSTPGGTSSSSRSVSSGSGGGNERGSYGNDSWQSSFKSDSTSRFGGPATDLGFSPAPGSLAAPSSQNVAGSGGGSDTVAGGSGNDGGGGGSSRVICTELYRQGKISRADWKRDLAYTSSHLTPRHVRGYHAWAIPTVRKMRKSRIWTEVWRVIGQARANQIAYIMGDRPTPDLFGSIAKVILEGFCWMVGGFVRDRNAAAELADDKGIV